MEIQEIINRVKQENQENDIVMSNTEIKEKVKEQIKSPADIYQNMNHLFVWDLNMNLKSFSEIKRTIINQQEVFSNKYFMEFY